MMFTVSPNFKHYIKKIEAQAKKLFPCKRDGGCILYIFIRSIYLQNLKYTVKRHLFFYLIFF